LLNANNLGGVGGQLQKQSTCNAFGGAATVGSTIFVPCSNGILQLTIGPGATINSGWKAPGGINGSPVVGGHTVYDISGGTLYALNSQTGAVRTQVNVVGSSSRFGTPTLWGNFVFVGTSSGISAVAIS
ncbi:MAG TPA: hypothetical protein VHV10_05365, partial [Ktedonobacteraceae bacterium]|nr:hypothetical protein [Ktedonobacteraceae bacterium]